MTEELKLLRILKNQLEEALCDTPIMDIKGTSYELLKRSDIEELYETLQKLDELE